MGLESHSSLCNKRGQGSDEVLRQKAKDIAVAQRIAEEVNEESGTSLGWTDLINVQRPGQAIVAPDGKPIEGDAKAGDDDANTTGAGLWT